MLQKSDIRLWSAPIFLVIVLNSDGVAMGNGNDLGGNEK